MPKTATSTLRSAQDRSASLRDVTFGFAHVGQSPLVVDFSLEVPHGQRVAIVGRSGVGKTTLLRLVAGLEHASAGEISRPERVAYVPQELGLFEYKTVLQNVQLTDQIQRAQVVDRAQSSRSRWSLSSRLEAARASTLRAITALTELQVAHLADRFPHELSGGQKQRVVLARAVAMQAALLLCDEPFSALDDHMRAESRLLLRTVVANHQTTTLLVTHNLNDAIDFADRIVVVTGRPIHLALDLEVAEADRSDEVRRAALVSRLRSAM